jgi:DUF1680 family protein
MLTDTEHSGFAGIHSLPFGAVTWDRGLMKETADVCMTSTVPFLQRMFDDKNISHVVENFKIAAGESSGSFDGTVFGDGDFYKWMEAAIYAAYTKNDDRLKAEIEAYIALIGRAQRPDGYISTKQIIGERDGSAQRMGDINDFEVYNFGHLFTAACIHNRVTGKNSLLAIAEKAAEYLRILYAEAERSGEVRTAVCPSHYMGLVELYRTTGNASYLILARKAVELRDQVQNGLDDNQDSVPLRSHEKIMGHAVRANYLYAGIADLYAETGEKELRAVLDRVYHSLTVKKIYITGGCGALYNGASPYGNFFHHQLVHQAYGYEYQLPNITAYNETCASVGLVMWLWRMFNIEPKAAYIDLLERAMINVNLAAVSLDGRKFFYENMLRRTEKLDFELVWPRQRTGYITSYCCPPNIARLTAQSAEYCYGIDNHSGDIYTALYGASTASFGNGLTIVQKTGYPYDGHIQMIISGATRPFVLYVRVPAWTEQGSIEGCGLQRKLTAADAGTYIAVPVPGDGSSHTVSVVFDMPVRLVTANPMVEEDTAQAAVMRGPLVYCMESPDCAEKTLDHLFLPYDSKFLERPMDVAGRTVLSLETEGVVVETGAQAEQPLYRAVSGVTKRKTPIRLIPYFAWDNRGFGEMKIWLPVLW